MKLKADIYIGSSYAGLIVSLICMFVARYNGDNEALPYLAIVAMIFTFMFGMEMYFADRFEEKEGEEDTETVD